MAVHVEKKSYPKKLIALTVLLTVVIGCVFYVVFSYADIFNVKKGGKIVIDSGMTVTDVAEKLNEDNIIEMPKIFGLLSRFGNYDKNIKPGTVIIEKGMTYWQILGGLVNASPEKVKITIPEGLEIKETEELFEGLVSKEDFEAAMLLDYDYWFLENLPQREARLEGYLFPDTYEFEAGTEARVIIDTMLKNFDKHFPEQYRSRAAELNKTVDEIITLASIVERESNSSADRAKIAGVFYNRLNKGMRLQSCATVQYILKERKSVLSTKDTEIQSPYNTYRNGGLPPGPISSPGEECIKAALYPEETSALFFVLGADGKHIFSDTYDEHLKAKGNK